MGLDMYLYKKHYVKNWDFMTPEQKHKITVKKGGKETPLINTEKLVYLVEDVGYWRKANSIHRWFVENVQGGQDDCREYPVYREQLEELLNLCKEVRDKSELVESDVKDGYTFDENGKKQYDYIEGKVIKDPTIAEELLPTQSGFFFGDTDYDQYYMEDINNTIKILEEELSIEYSDHPEYVYCSSW